MQLRALLLAGMAVLALPAPAAADVNLADVSAPTTVSAHRGRVVWSELTPATGENRLVSRFQGRTQALPVPPSPTPLEADLGPGPRGGTVAVYARCQPGCDVYLFDFAAGRERRVAAAASPGATSSRPRCGATGSPSPAGGGPSSACRNSGWRG